MYARRICRRHQFKAVRKWKYAADARKEVGTIMKLRIAEDRWALTRCRAI